MTFLDCTFWPSVRLAVMSRVLRKNDSYQNKRKMFQLFFLCGWCFYSFKYIIIITFNIELMNVEFLAKSNTPIQDCFWRQIQYVECRLETRHHHDITETCMLGQKGQPSCLWDSLVQMVQIKFFFKNLGKIWSQTSHDGCSEFSIQIQKF